MRQLYRSRLEGNGVGDVKLIKQRPVSLSISPSDLMVSRYAFTYTRASCQTQKDTVVVVHIATSPHRHKNFHFIFSADDKW